MIKKFATISLEKTNMSSNLKGAFGRFTQKIYPKQLQPQQIIEQFYLLLEYTEEAFWVIDTNLNILIFNNKFYERYLTYFNISLEIGRSVLYFIEPENIGRIKGLYSRVFNGETFETETPRKAENGEMHTFLNRFKPYYDPQGNIIGAFVSTIDITDTKRTQICLQKIEDKYRSVIENSHHAFLYSKTDGTILSTNHRASEIFGYNIEEFRQVNLKQIINPQGVNYEKVVEQIKQNNKIEGELLGIRKNGESFPFEFTSTIYEDINGEKRVCTFLTDITERKLIEKAVEKSEKRFRALVENAVDIIILTNKEGKVLYVSPAYEKITGFSLLEVIGKDGKYLLPIEGVEMGIQVLQKLLQNPGVAIPRTTRLITKENKLIWVEGVVTNFLHDENVCAIVANFRDITDKKIAEEKLEQSERNLKAIFENTAEGFVLLDTEFNVKVFNSKAKELALFDSETKLELNKSIFELVPEHIKEIKKDYFTRVLRGENMQFDRLYQHENQEDVWLTYSLRQVTEDGVCKGICITVKDISERKKAEKELINKEYRFRSLIEHSQDMVTLINLNGYVEYISPSVERILGYKTEEVATIHITEVIHPDDLELFSDKFKILFEQTDSQIHATLRCMNKNGKYVWVEGNASNMLDIEGVEAIVINFRDITERKNFEDQQKLLASIIDYSEDAILSTDLNGVISSWNRGAESTYGYSSQEMLGSNIFRIVPPIKQAEELEIIEKIKEGFTIENYETLRVKKNGEIIYVSLTTSPIKDNMGNIIGASKIARDITEKKLGEDKIRNNERRFRSLFQNSADGIVLLDYTGSIIEVPASGKKIIGYEDLELIGKIKNDLVHPDDLPTITEVFLEVVSTPDIIKNIEYRCLMPDGTYKWLEATCHNLLHDPLVKAIVLNFRDIAERKNQELEREKLIETLNQNNTDLRHFSYITSHNLKAPLSNLVGFVKLLDDFEIEDPILEKIMEGFKTSTIMLNETVSDLVKILVIRDNNMIALKETNFNKIFNQVFAQLDNLIKEVQPSIDMNFRYAPYLVSNETYLESIFMNLVTNAIKYRSYDRPLLIDIRSYTEGDMICLEFEDNGIGIDLERHKDKLFRLYQRFHDRPNSKGMGLYLIKTQMESLGGSISVESKVNVGTKFILKFKQ